MTKWPTIALGEVARLAVDAEKVDPSRIYNFAGVYSFGRGLFVRGEQSGAETTYKCFHRLHEDDFVISQPKAWEGAVARITAQFEGWYLSPVFPTFKVNQERLMPKFLEWFLKQEWVWHELHQNAKGMGARRESVSPDQFLSLEVPLPPLSEQRRLVARIDALAAKIEEVERMREQVEAGNRQLLSAAFNDITLNAPRRRLGDVAPLIRRPATIDPAQSYPGVSVRSFGKGTFHNPPMSGSEITWQKPHLVKAGDILVSNIKAWEGAIAVAKPEDAGRYGSHRYLTYVPIPGLATACFVCFYLLTEEGLFHVGEASPGSADRNRTTSAKAMLEIGIPSPSYQRQIWFGELHKKIESISVLQTDITTERAAFLPACLDRTFRRDF
jgi:type I restriction enzyme S subunit